MERRPIVIKLDLLGFPLTCMTSLKCPQSPCVSLGLTGIVITTPVQVLSLACEPDLLPCVAHFAIHSFELKVRGLSMAVGGLV